MSATAQKDRYAALADFVIRHHGPAAGWPAGRTAEWLRWYARQKVNVFIEIFDRSAGDSGPTRALLLARPVSNALESSDSYHVDPSGDVLWVDMAIAPEDGFMAVLWCNMRHHYPDRDWIAYERADRKLRFFRFEQMGRHIMTAAPWNREDKQHG
jgi:hypothetical protein